MKTIANILRGLRDKSAMTGFLLLCIPVMLQAQHKLESHLNMFRADDIITKQQVSYKNPGRTGSNVLWDFSELTVVNEAYELAYFSGSEPIITGIEHLTGYNYSLSNDSLLLWGYDNQSTQMKNKQAELLLKFPVNYGDSIKNYYYGHGKHGNRLELDAMGTVETTADAYGMMVLPNKDTLKQVLRTHTIKYFVEDTKAISEEYQTKHKSSYSVSSDSVDYRLNNDSVVFVVETFRWYEKGYRYPVFETVRSWEQHSNNRRHQFLNTAFFYPPQEHYYLDDDEDNLSILENEGNEIVDPWAGLTYNSYPNPVRAQFGNGDLSSPSGAHPDTGAINHRTALQG
jgi:hypothetical protein